MPRRKRVTGKELIKAVRRFGFEVVRIQYSHHRARHPDGRVTTVPVHAGETIGPGLLGQILQDCDLTHEQLDQFLQQAMWFFRWFSKCEAEEDQAARACFGGMFGYS